MKYFQALTTKPTFVKKVTDVVQVCKDIQPCTVEVYYSILHCYQRMKKQYFVYWYIHTTVQWRLRGAVPFS